MGDCPRAEIRDLLPDWVHGALSPEARREVEAHLAACPACAAEVQMLRAARGAMNRVRAVDVARITAAVRREVGRGSAGSPTARRLRTAAVAALAAGVLGVALATGEIGSRVIGRFPRRIYVADSGGARAGGRADATELQMGGGISDLADDDLEALLDRLQVVDGLPPDTPASVGSTLGDEAT